MSREGPEAVELSVSDYGQLDSLASYLRLATPDVSVSRSHGRAGRGKQGALDVLMVAADSSVLVAVIKVLPQFLRSRKPGVSATVTVKGKQKELTVTADDARDIERIVREFLDD